MPEKRNVNTQDSVVMAETIESSSGERKATTGPNDTRRSADAQGAETHALSSIDERPTPSTQAQRTQSRVADRTGIRIGHFRLCQVLGKGGMGVVYEAIDETLHRTVALKVLPPEISSHPERRARMLREARAAAAVSHPNIATVYEAGEDAGQIFIAMELVEGETLRQKLNGGLRLTDALPLVRQVARGMTKAHEQGVLHRDLKPENVMVGPDAQVKILDFGLAKRMTADSGPQPAVSEETFHTREGLIVGTPQYMSPERAQGRSDDERADIYSFGVMLYEMATGDVPFSGAPTHVLNAVSNEEPTPPSMLNLDIDRKLERVILRCLARRPTDRYRSFREVSRDLDALGGDSTPSAANVPPTTERQATLGSERELPTGTVTLLHAELDGAAKVLHEAGEGYDALMARYHELLADNLGSGGGQVVHATQDGLLAVFSTARQALWAAQMCQKAAEQASWPAGLRLATRIGIHTGEPKRVGAGYTGLAVHRTVRIGAAARGGQVLISAATRAELTAQDLENLELRDLGAHALRDLHYPERLYEVAPPGGGGGRGVATVVRAAVERPNNLPPQSTSFVGRQHEILEVSSLLKRAEGRMVTLTGPGGSGKTRLSLEVARALEGDFPAGMLQVRLASIADPALIPTQIAQTLGVQETPGHRLLDSIKSRIGAGKMMLLLDNFEQLIEGAQVLAELLGDCLGLKVLVTSQRPLKLSFEQEYPVAPLQLPVDALGPEVGLDIIQYEAVRLFVERVRSIKPSFVVRPEDARTLGAICRQLDGLPLAIELAASRMKMLTLPVLLERLSDRLTLLKGGARDADQRQQTLRATIDWSHNLLTPTEKLLFRRAAVFVGGFSIEAAEEVCQLAGEEPLDVFEGLASLVDKSLLVQNEVDGEPRLSMLETIREYGRDQLKHSPELAPVQAQHAAYVVALAEAMAPDLMGREQRMAVSRLLTEAGNLRAALDWSLAQPSTGMSTRLLRALLWLWIPQGHLTEGRSWAARAVAQAKQLGTTLDRAEILEMAGWLALIAGDYAAALPHCQESLAIYRELGAESRSARAKVALGTTSTGLGEIETGPALVREALDTARLCDDTYGTTLALIALGELARAMGDKAQARTYYEEAMTLLRAMGNMFWPGLLIQNLAHFQLHDGNWQTAAQLLSETLDLGLEYKYPMVVNLYLAAMAGVAVVRGRYEEGMRLYGAVATQLRAMGSTFEPTDQAEVERHMAVAREALGEAATAAWSDGTRWTREQAIAATLALRS